MEGAARHGEHLGLPLTKSGAVVDQHPSPLLLEGRRPVASLLEVTMHWNTWVRQVHRWVTYAPLLPLAVLLLTGSYLFVLPHATKRRSRQRG